MSRRYLAILMALLAMAAAGCTSGKAPPEKMGGEATPSISIIPAEQMMGQVQAQKPFDLSRVRWAEYVVAPDRHTTVRLEIDGMAAGSSVKKIERTVMSSDPSYIRVFTGDGILRMRASQATSSMESSWLASFEQLKKDDPVLSADDITGTPSGSETVSVPLGMFSCNVYEGGFNGSDAAYWGAPGIPVPIKVHTACDDATLELSGWG
ncbi:hypothetical protein Mtc_0775 [Methanocella conradii HZ254]|uniref:Lipoprotein n=1 Tax=Methanocella conradii (strain DSM 24694 / JCM 17849 / CGMCC 1.5162 / HZ254) TaxID=1041930 RepID=H8I9B9_METCZ|nr:hypothetical protein [Methanocella conradii]AFC99537.1 hypothetical protein Mtc_0775 [Methanocella conradii HZ254]